MTTTTILTCAIPVLLLSIFAIVLFRSRQVPTYEALVNRYKGPVLNDLWEFIDEELPDTDDNRFWARSRGLHGAWQRISTARILLQICQLAYRDGRILPEDFAEVARFARLQMLYTALAYPEAFISWILRGAIPHVAARTALQFCAATFARTHTLAIGEDSPQCLALLR